jgi:hypothetical protein
MSFSSFSSFTSEVVLSAKQAAAAATASYLQTNPSWYPCGFAWIEVYGVKGSSKLGKELMKAGFTKNYGGGLRLSNTWSGTSQSMVAAEIGADAAAKVLTNLLGVQAYGVSRID